MKKSKAKKPHPDLHHYLSVLRLTERAIINDGTDLDNYFKNQAEKFKKLIAEIQ